MHAAHPATGTTATAPTSAASRVRVATVRALALVILATVAPPAALAAPRPPADIHALDHAWDDGSQVDLLWTLSPDDASVQEYVISRREPNEPRFERVDSVPRGTTSLIVEGLRPDHEYTFQLVAVGTDATESPAIISAPVVPRMDWFDGTRGWFLLTFLLFSGAVLLFIQLARRGIALRLRPIAGLKAIDDAVGRATEMGRKCLFIPGTQDLNDLQTIAGLSILSRVAKTTAEYDAALEVPTCRSLVMTAARETIHSAFLEAGRPEGFNPDDVYYVTDEQFGYVGYLQGSMIRDRPAACFYLGAFYAESLILAETGNRVGAIQIAGTAEPAQLPFFVAACDYTLIGEEFFAASAYLSGEPDQLGSLKGQDVGKAIVALGIIAGVAAATFVALTGSPILGAVLDYFENHVLG